MMSEKGLGVENPLFLSPEEFERWHKRRMKELDEQYERFMKQWEHTETPEFRQEIARAVIEGTHAPEFSTPEESEGDGPKHRATSQDGS
jgi:hypothetical protein